MTTIAIKGGLGNQLFQYAYGRSLELSGNKVIFDISFYNGNKAVIDTSRDFKLNNFNIATKAEFSSKTRRTANLIKKVLTKLHLIGYEFWQSEKYFKSMEEEIRKEFTMKMPLGLKASQLKDQISRTTNAVSVHIRRSDYVSDATTNEYWGTCDANYYSRALEYISSKIGSNIQLFVFSDDIAWAKENMPFKYPMNYVSSPEIKDYEELYLMSLCRHHIIANSTFSWWGAWLDTRHDKIVIAPKVWSLKQQHLYRDIIPKEWTKI